MTGSSPATGKPARSRDPATLFGPIEGTLARDSRNGAGAIRAFGEHKLPSATAEVAKSRMTGSSPATGKPAANGAVENRRSTVLIEPDGRLSRDPATLFGPIEGTLARDSRNGAGAIPAPCPRRPPRWRSRG
jgi:hypothetical protein